MNSHLIFLSSSLIHFSYPSHYSLSHSPTTSPFTNAVPSLAHSLVLQVLLGADDLLPIFSYCLVYAEVPCAYSELAFMNDFVLDEDLNGEIGYVLATLHTSLHIVSHFLEEGSGSSPRPLDMSSPPHT